MQTAQQLMPVPFYEDTVVLVGKDNEPLVSMKPIVINMGLSLCAGDPLRAVDVEGSWRATKRGTGVLHEGH